MRTFVLLVTLLGTHFVFANDPVAVGTCRPKLRSFTTIQAAVSGVSPWSTVLVCPGTYAEQVVISQSLNLQGIADSNLDEAIITIPGGGLPTLATSIFGETVAAQVLVQTTGVVNITNITTDGTGGNQSCTNWLAGIFYSGASGVVARARSRNQIDGGCGIGIWAENGGSTGAWLTVQGNSVHDGDGVGIFLGAGGSSTLNVDVHDNFVSPNSAGAIGILAAGITGDVNDNDLNTGAAGIFDLSSGLTVNANGITSAQFGVLLLAPGTLQSNDIMNTGTGVSINAPGATLQANRITESSSAAVEFSCNNATVSHNTINDAVVGLSDVPASFSGTNTFANTGTVTTGGCVAAAAAIPLGAAPLSQGNQFLQWRTPANPTGIKH